MAAGKARHVVVIVWDGMRPDFVTESNTPTLWQLAREGVTFQNHHPVYLSSTEVNGTALATGAYPSHDGIVANKEYRPGAVPPAPPMPPAKLPGPKPPPSPTGVELLPMPPPLSPADESFAAPPNAAIGDLA